MLISDISAAETANKAKVDEHIRIALNLGYLKIIIDLCEHNNGRPNKYDVFWRIAAQFLKGKAANAVTVVDEHRHDTIVHLVTAISVNNLLYQMNVSVHLKHQFLAHNSYGCSFGLKI